MLNRSTPVTTLVMPATNLLSRFAADEALCLVRFWLGIFRWRNYLKKRAETRLVVHVAKHIVLAGYPAQRGGTPSSAGN